jgi:hypothetical protein
MNRGPNIVIDADYVIVRGVELRNAATHGILIKAGHHDIVVEQWHISGWGRFAGPVSFGNAGGDLDSAIYAEKGCGRLTIQRNLIEHPRGAASDWEFGHPVGPQGVSVIESAGENVIRYNDIWASEDHGFNDGYVGKAPDLGAFEVGAPPLQFGRRAYLRWDEGWAPWEVRP